MLPAILAFAACSGDPTIVETVEDDLRHLRLELSANNTGRVKVVVPVKKAEQTLLLTAEVDGGRTVHVLSVTAPDGETVLDGDLWQTSNRLRSNALFPAGTVSLNWPMAPGDRVLDRGDWQVELGLIEGGEYAAGPVSVDVHLSQDPDFSVGELDVAVVYTGELGENGSLREAMRAATEQWAGMLGDVAIDVTFTPAQWPDDAPTASPADDTERAYADISAALGPRTLAVVLVETLNVPAVGVAGDVPGPLVATERSAVVVSHLASSGVDGIYDAEEIRLLAETLAHESGHYLGLFHPVESDWVHSDSLEDTPGCADQRDCEASLGHNLMFPYPVCVPSPCVPQTMLSSDQAGVLQRNTAVW